MTLPRHHDLQSSKVVACAVLGLAASLAPGVHAANSGVLKPTTSTAATTTSRPADAATINAILNRWEPVAVQAGTHTSYWREMYGTQLAQMPANLLATFTMLPITDASTAVQDYAHFVQTFRQTAMSTYTQQLKSGEKSYLKALGAPTRDQVFVPIQPCRIVDTRNVGGAIGAGTARSFVFYVPNGAAHWSDQGGVAGTASSSCPGTVITSGGGTLGNVAPTAAVATVTVVNPTAPGNYIVWGAGTAPPTTSALNWDRAGEVVANTTTIPRGSNPPGGTDFSIQYNGPSGSADVVVDVVGYFVPSSATELDCVPQESTGGGAGDVPNGAARQIDAPFCPTGYSRTAVNCVYHNTNIAGLYLQEVAGGSFSRCMWINGTGGTLNSGDMGAQSTCCRVPGQ